jgi:hypothetical protein
MGFYRVHGFIIPDQFEGSVTGNGEGQYADDDFDDAHLGQENLGDQEQAAHCRHPRPNNPFSTRHYARPSSSWNLRGFLA